mmetsp:Transcript_12466/g.24728  ORF Transcript_12466/g.24728 Transcript_12466/m.24728 type:complete len:171 (+) Transcript_12466:57-569(+)|eukprot:CAMPEP_0173398950 /NCGR_PEP_ID=MMETSP1356-20130122/43440_1 /TAXON_ID=77927 ORGANISM="Hemiselmis virescens, Strain PCC157" /NCGR_SAMPLE_ID=MMETSP1356 /ASSEMBLY_ACC=CAM_ASM_000847 /LENGTH=170 /DNA_ID=CAMNT_0014358555 /DNA_START=52 /DNA_END=564 /DNA_ORIENTATION=+
MGKVVKQKQHRGVHRGAGAFHPEEVSEAAAERGAAEVEVNDGHEVEAHKASNLLALSRGQRKRLAKKVAAERKKTLAGEGLKTNLKLKAGTLGDLESLSRSLAAAESSSKSQEKAAPNRVMKMTKKNRKRVLVAEVANFQAVLSHPAFQANPMSTIQSHLQNSIRGGQSM